MPELKCYCGHLWTYEELEKYSTEDEFGHYYECPKTKDCNDEGCYGLWSIATEWSNGQLNGMYNILRKYHLETKENKRLLEIRNKHKYTIESFIKR